jgi:hypothetical protein
MVSEVTFKVALPPPNDKTVVHSVFAFGFKLGLHLKLSLNGTSLFVFLCCEDMGETVFRSVVISGDCNNVNGLPRSVFERRACSESQRPVLCKGLWKHGHFYPSGSEDRLFGVHTEAPHRCNSSRPAVFMRIHKYNTFHYVYNPILHLLQTPSTSPLVPLLRMLCQSHKQSRPPGPARKSRGQRRTPVAASSSPRSQTQ